MRTSLLIKLKLTTVYMKVTRMHADWMRYIGVFVANILRAFDLISSFLFVCFSWLFCFFIGLLLSSLSLLSLLSSSSSSLSLYMSMFCS